MTACLQALYILVHNRIRLRYGGSSWTPLRGGGGGVFKYAFLQPNELITNVKGKYWNGYVLCALFFDSNMNKTYQFNDCVGGTEVENSAVTKNGLAYISGRYGYYMDSMRFWSLS